jgi:hypothetical protein
MIAIESDFQFLNYMVLNVMQRQLLEDRPMACLKFDLPLPVGEYIANMPAAKTHGVVTAMGDTPVFSLRPDFGQLIEPPSALTIALRGLPGRRPRTVQGQVQKDVQPGLF